MWHCSSLWLIQGAEELFHVLSLAQSVTRNKGWLKLCLNHYVCLLVGIPNYSATVAILQGSGNSRAEDLEYWVILDATASQYWVFSLTSHWSSHMTGSVNFYIPAVSNSVSKWSAIQALVGVVSLSMLYNFKLHTPMRCVGQGWNNQQVSQIILHDCSVEIVSSSDASMLQTGISLACTTHLR